MLKFSAKIDGREEINLEISINESMINSFTLTCIGGPKLLTLVESYRQKIKGEVKSLEVPKGNDTGSMLLREIILKLKGQWNFPYEEDELCHCRAVLTSTVDGAILTGAHTSEEVSRLTSASTACGTCRPDVEAMIKYRLSRD